VTVTGKAELPSPLSVWAAREPVACPASPGEAAGLQGWFLAVARVGPGPSSLKTPFTPPTAGAYRICAWPAGGEDTVGAAREAVVDARTADGALTTLRALSTQRERIELETVGTEVDGELWIWVAETAEPCPGDRQAEAGVPGGIFLRSYCPVGPGEFPSAHVYISPVAGTGRGWAWLTEPGSTIPVSVRQIAFSVA
jgi:hypothetical protein